MDLTNLYISLSCNTLSLLSESLDRHNQDTTTLKCTKQTTHKTIRGKLLTNAETEAKAAEA